MEDRLRTLIRFLEKAKARHLGMAANLPPGDYVKGYNTGAAMTLKLTIKWLTEDVLKEKVSAKAEVESTGT